MKSEKTNLFDTLYGRFSNYQIGILLMISSSLSLSLMAVLIKFLINYPLMEISLFRSLPTVIIIPVILKKRKINFFGNNKILLTVRCFFGTVSLVGYFYTCRMMILTDAMAIRQLTPIFVFFLSIVLLKEYFIKNQVPLLLISFLGTIFIIRPGIRLDISPAIIGIISSFFLSVSYITIRRLRMTDHVLVIVNYLSWSVFLVSLITLLIQRQFIFPKSIDLGLLILLGLLGLGSQFTLTMAYQLVPVSLVSLYMYSQIIFSAIFDFLFFRNTPGVFSIMGTLFIISGGYLNYKLYLSNQI